MGKSSQTSELPVSITWNGKALNERTHPRILLHVIDLLSHTLEAERAVHRSPHLKMKHHPKHGDRYLLRPRKPK